MAGQRSFEVVGLVLQADAPHSESKQYGEDSETVYQRTFRLPRADGEGQPLLFHVRNAYLASDRYDHESNAVWVQAPGQQRVTLYHESDNEKYDHRQDSQEFEGLEALRVLLQLHGHPSLSEAQLKELVLLVSRNYYDRS